MVYILFDHRSAIFQNSASIWAELEPTDIRSSRDQVLVRSEL